MKPVTIKYCAPCGYRARAERLAERLREELGRESRLVPGNFGVFKVWDGDRLVFDKRRTRPPLGWIGLGAIPGDDILMSLVERSAEEGS